MEKRFFQILGLAILIAIVWHFWQPFWRYDLNEAVNSGNQEKIIVSIEKGSSAKSIADKLDDSELIVSKVSFLRTVKDEDLEGSLRYGSFVLEKSMTLREIVAVLTTQGTGEMALTVPEGWTISDIDTRLTDLGLIEAGAFRTCTFNCDFSDYEFLGEDRSLEGFLFPDTYFLDGAKVNSEELIWRMLNNFDQKWTDEMDADLKKSDRTLREVVTVASMLEKEVRTDADLPIVAGIIWKRLDHDWMLGIDATLLYIDEDGALDSADLAKESPYNTRLETGLPPTAIGNPGFKALTAALHPETSDYWFYLTDSTGAVHYAVSNAEHEANKSQYID